MNTNGLTWLLLVALSAGSFRAAESGTSASAGRVVLFLVLAAALKSLLVGWQFMELRTAHPLWRAGFALLLGGYMISVRLLWSPPGQ